MWYSARMGASLRWWVRGDCNSQIPSIDNSSAVSASTRMFWLYTRVACCLLRRSVSRGTLTIELSNFGGYITNLLSWE